MTEFDPIVSLERIARRWWWVALACIVGGALGYLSSLFLKPIYEARAELYVNMNEAQFAEDNRLKFVDVKEREAAMVPITAFLYEADVIDAVDTVARQHNILLDTEDFEYEFTLTRIYTRWLFIVRRADPNEAAVLANAWAQAALDALNRAYLHAVAARALELELFTLDQCFSQNDFTAANRCAGTALKDTSALEAYRLDLNARYKSELDAARNLDHTLDFRRERPAAVPDEPVLNRPAMLILAAALIGFILGAFAAASLPHQKAGT